MKFKINVEKFMKSLIPLYDIAIRNYEKEWESAQKITFNTSEDKLVATSHGGYASIIVPISNSKMGGLQYECKEEGEATLNAESLFKSLDSFPKSEIIEIDTSTHKFIMTYHNQAGKQAQKLVLESEKVKPPVLATEFEKSVEVNREVFIEGMEKVFFAIGFAETQPHYMCQLFQVEKNKVRFAAGTGARFAISDVDGKNIVKTDKKENFIIPKQNISNIITVLKNSSVENITIKQAQSHTGKTDNPAQIVIELEDVKLIILGIDTSIVYPPLNKIILIKFLLNLSIGNL